jgi:hypothetical protein
MKKYLHNGLDWFVLQEFDNRVDAVDRRDQLKDKMNIGKIEKGVLEVIDRKQNIKTERGIRKGKFYLIGRPYK